MNKKGAIDNGNTLCKAGVFGNNSQLLSCETFNDLQHAVEWLEKQEVDEAMVSDVRGVENITSGKLRLRFVDSKLKLPFINQYKTPETLGADRVAVMAAVSSLYPGQASIVFDIGTCMTIDILNPENIYSGGNISPGINMRLKAMQHFTNKLPLASADNAYLKMGDNTLSALANGAISGLMYEIEGYIAKALTQYPNINILLCGGDAHYFEKQLKYKIFANPNLVLHGLYQLLVFND